MHNCSEPYVTMNLKENPQIKDILVRLKKNMSGFIELEPYYTPKDVDVCIQMIQNHLDHMAQTFDREEAITLVKKTVLDLNDLNEKCNACLIETDQREDICEIIIMAGHLKGYNEMNEDITEEWREW